MLIRFYSSETGELLMFGDVARSLLQMIGKETTARGAFAQAEMLAAAEALKAAVQREAAPVQPEDDEDEERPLDRPVGLSSRAWPLIDMLERTSRGGPKANIVWKAPGDF